MRILFFGGRKFDGVDEMFKIMHMLHQRYTILCVIEGEQIGADQLARNCAQLMGISVEPYHADWNLFGNYAGNIRNARMLREGKPDMGVGFPGGPGTADMLKRLTRAGVPTMFGTQTPTGIQWSWNKISLAPKVHST